ncbi:MAG: alpha/beta fold hydrolase [Hydrogenophaga sp.]|nr:alpha/beta fold hydrolase [Hydrogenophaga sp.]
MNRPDDQFTTVGGHQVRYWQVGREGSAVVCLHGIGCSVLEWEHSIHALATRHRVYALDLLGCGLTAKPSDATYDVATLARFALGFMDAVGLEKASLVGNSLGARVSIECAAMAPQRVQSLVLSAPATMANPTLFDFRLASLPVLGELLTQPTAFGTARLWRTAVADPACITPEMVQEKVALARQPGAQKAFMKTLRGLVHLRGFRPSVMDDAHAKARCIQAPTCVIWGRQDVFLPVAHLDTLMRLMPHAKPVVLAPCGHVPMLERPADFSRIALDFLSDAGVDPPSNGAASGRGGSAEQDVSRFYANPAIDRGR